MNYISRELKSIRFFGRINSCIVIFQKNKKGKQNKLVTLIV